MIYFKNELFQRSETNQNITVTTGRVAHDYNLNVNTPELPIDGEAAAGLLKLGIKAIDY